MPARALRCVAECLNEGAIKYDAWNWLKCPVQEHLNHCDGHINEYQQMVQTPEEIGSEDKFIFPHRETTTAHLIHNATRAIMALEVHLRGLEN